MIERRVQHIMKSKFVDKNGNPLAAQTESYGKALQ